MYGVVEGERSKRGFAAMALCLRAALRSIEQTARALAAAEACGVVHGTSSRRISCWNRIQAAVRRLFKVIDYGIAKILNPKQNAASSKLEPDSLDPGLSPARAVRSFRTDEIDTRSDIYSLGATFWYLLSGRVHLLGARSETLRQTGRGTPARAMKKLTPGACGSRCCSRCWLSIQRSAANCAGTLSVITAVTQNSARKHARAGSDRS